MVLSAYVGLPTYAAPPPSSTLGRPPTQFGVNVPLQVGTAGYSHQFNVPVTVDSAHLGAAAGFASQQLSSGRPGHLPPGQWSDGVFSCRSSLVIAALTCCCPCVRFGLSVHRAFPDIPFTRPCTAFLTLYGAFLGLWVVGYVLLPAGWLWVPAMIIALPVVVYAAYYRGKMREKYAIRGTAVTDCVLDMFCLCCAMAQEARHVDRDSGIAV